LQFLRDQEALTTAVPIPGEHGLDLAALDASSHVNAQVDPHASEAV
jgi:hypothetical protein